MDPWEKVEDETTKDTIKGGVCEREMFGIHAMHTDVFQATTPDFTTGFLHHPVCYVYADDAPIAPDLLRGRKEVCTASSAHIKHLGTAWDVRQ